MICIDFLKNGVAGQEFMDFQKTTFYDQLVACLDPHITVTDGISRLNEGFGKEALVLIEKFTGFSNITFKFVESKEVNLGVDVAFFSPNHVLNSPYLDSALNITETSLYRWFRDHKEKLFKGSIDYKTGKVDGSFKTMPVLLYINPNLSLTFPEDKVEKTGVPLAGILAGALVHELGHVFGASMLLHTAVMDNVIGKAAVRSYKSSKTEEERVMVLKDTAALLEVDPAKLKELQEIATNPDEGAFILYWNKLTIQRNRSRSLSVGVEQMTSEVIADMYAIRMGCHKGIVAAVSVLIDKGLIKVTLDNLMFSVMMTLLTQTGGVIYLAALGVSLPVLSAWMGLIFFFFFTVNYFSRGYSGAYNSDHRRLEDAVRQLLAKLKEDSQMPAKDKAVLVDDIAKLLELVKVVKPWYDNTVVGRAMGWFFAGNDFKKQEIDHFTQALANTELSVIAHKLARLKARRDGTDRTPEEENKTYEA